MEQTILVTGAAGFIGSHVCDGLLEAGYRVRGADNLSSGRLENLANARQHPHFEFARIDLAGPEAAAACRGVHAVLHHAARVSVPASFADPARTRRDTLDSTLNLLDHSRKAGVQRFILASTAAVYGDGTCPVVEAAPLHPLSPYGEAKRDAERALADSGIDGASLRYFNAYGRRQPPESSYAGVIPLFADRMRRGQTIEIHGDGMQTRDFVHVSDIVRANLSALRHDGRLNGGPINIGTGRGATLIELIDALGRVLEAQPRVKHTDARRGDIRDSWADVSLARRTLDWQAEVSLEQGLRDMLGGP